MNNPYKDWPNAFEEGLQKSREGDLNSAVQLLEAAILQDPQDSEVRSRDVLFRSRGAETLAIIPIFLHELPGINANHQICSLIQYRAHNPFRKHVIPASIFYYDDLFFFLLLPFGSKNDSF